MEALICGNAEKLQRTFYHPGRVVAVAVHDAVTQRTMVRADTECRSILLAHTQQGEKAIAHAIQLRAVGRIIVLDDLELLLIDVVAGIDAHLFDDASCDLGRIRRVVNVGH